MPDHATSPVSPAAADRGDLPVAVIGAGPIGLAAAAHLHERGLPVVVLEAGAAVGAALRQWAHVRLFSPWTYVVDAAARRLLEPTGWSSPDPQAHPMAGEVVRDYLEPLATVPAIAGALRLGTRVRSVTRLGVDKLRDDGRAEAPFVLAVERDGVEEQLLARAVVDASGTWQQPNPAGAGGVPAPGERHLGDRLAAAMPDVRGAERDRYAGRATLVLGAGHSAFGVLAELAALADEVPGTVVHWAVRRDALGDALGGGAGDALPARGALGARVRALLAEGRVQLHTGVRVIGFDRAPDGRVVVRHLDGPALPPVDQVVAATGFRPDLSLLSELRVEVDPVVEAPPKLAPLIDPNHHSCGSVPPHGANELAHPEPDLYVVGSKSYGRAPTFLLLTGYEQVRSVAAALAGDHAAAADVRLVLPETGVCSVPTADAPCC